MNDVDVGELVLRLAREASDLLVSAAVKERDALDARALYEKKMAELGAARNEQRRTMRLHDARGSVCASKAKTILVHIERAGDGGASRKELCAVWGGSGHGLQNALGRMLRSGAIKRCGRARYCLAGRS